MSTKSDSMDPKSKGTFLLETLKVGETGCDGDLELRVSLWSGLCFYLRKNEKVDSIPQMQTAFQSSY